MKRLLTFAIIALLYCAVAVSYESNESKKEVTKVSHIQSVDLQHSIAVINFDVESPAGGFALREMEWENNYSIPDTHFSESNRRLIADRSPPKIRHL